MSEPVFQILDVNGVEVRVAISPGMSVRAVTLELEGAGSESWGAWRATSTLHWRREASDE
ncbi:MAG: hypothetical protein WC700_14445 [Gemmatimonadaceae bacterium]|jgi:hypothetical protein